MRSRGQGALQGSRAFKESLYEQKLMFLNTKPKRLRKQKKNKKDKNPNPNNDQNLRKKTD